MKVSDKLIEIYDKFNQTQDIEVRKQQSIEFQTIFQENQLTVWLWHQPNLFGIANSVKDYRCATTRFCSTRRLSSNRRTGGASSAAGSVAPLRARIEIPWRRVSRNCVVGRGESIRDGRFKSWSRG